MYGRFIGFTLSKNVYRSTARVYPSASSFSSSVSTHPNNKDLNLVDDIRAPVPVSGSGTGSESSIGADDRVNVVKTSTTSSSSSNPHSPSSSTYVREDDNGGDMASYAADTVKQGVVKAMETGLDIGEMAKKTLDNVFDVTKGAAHQVKEAVAGDPAEKNDVPPTDRFVDDLRKRADGYDLKNKRL